MIGGYFKFHWVDPQEITYKIDDPKSPLTADVQGQAFDRSTTRPTPSTRTRSRATNVHVLTSIDYDKMSDEDKAKEQRTAHRSRLRAQLDPPRGQRPLVLHGARPHERNYAMKPLLEHLLAGIQYALGDLKADDSPSVKPG